MQWPRQCKIGPATNFPSVICVLLGGGDLIFPIEIHLQFISIYGDYVMWRKASHKMGAGSSKSVQRTSMMMMMMMMMMMIMAPLSTSH